MNSAVNQRLLRSLVVLTGFGMLVSLYAVYQHFSHGSSFCNINAQFNCDTVNRGPYSEIVGVPVAVIGALGYLWLHVLAHELVRRPRVLVRNLFAASIVGAVLFTVYLAWVSHVKIGAWCPTCIASYVVIGVVTIIFGVVFVCDSKTTE